MVADCLEPLEFRDGGLVIGQGDPGEKFYLIEKGEAVALQMFEGREVEVGRMSGGMYFGERALLTNEPRAATVRAVGTLKVAALDRAAFERLLGDVKDLMSRHIQSYPTAAAVVRSQSLEPPKPVAETKAADEDRAVVSATPTPTPLVETEAKPPQESSPSPVAVGVAEDDHQRDSSDPSASQESSTPADSSPAPGASE